jgi:hypothetical protein
MIVSADTLKQLQIAFPLGLISRGGLLNGINSDLPRALHLDHFLDTPSAKQC